jgi:hypothetical protein
MQKLSISKEMRKVDGLKTLLLLGSVVGLLIGTASAWAYTAADCIDCHRPNSTQSTRRIDIGAYDNSVHGDQMACTDCHTRIVDEEHTMLPGSGAVDCTQCHATRNQHGTGSESAPRCHDCHTRHAILPQDDPRAATHSENLVQTCGRCHPGQSGRADYLSWLPGLKIATHTKGDLSLVYSRNRCLGCHQGQGSHGLAEIVDPAACDRCHLTPEGNNALWGYFHPQADWRKQPGTFAAGMMYQVLLAALLGAGLAFYGRKFSRRS